MSEEIATGAAVAATRFQQGDVRAFDELIHLYYNRVYFVAYSWINQPAAAEDITQEVFIAAFVGIKSLNNPNSVGSWLFSLTRNICKNRLRRNRIESDFLQRIREEAGMDNWFRENKNPRDLATETETVIQVRQAVEQLKPELREIVLLHYGEEMTQSEIARHLGVAPYAVHRKLEKAYAFLKEITRSNSLKSLAELKPSDKSLANLLTVIGSIGILSNAAQAKLLESFSLEYGTNLFTNATPELENISKADSSSAKKISDNLITATGEKSGTLTFLSSGTGKILTGLAFAGVFLIGSFYYHDKNESPVTLNPSVTGQNFDPATGRRTGVGKTKLGEKQNVSSTAASLKSSGAGTKNLLLSESMTTDTVLTGKIANGESHKDIEIQILALPELKPLSNEDLVLEFEAANLPTQPIKTDDKGKIVLKEEFGSHTFNVYHKGHQLYNYKNLTASFNRRDLSGTELPHLIVFKPQTLTGKITDKDTGESLANALVEFSFSNGISLKTQTDSTGNYVFNQIPPDEATLNISHPGYTLPLSYYKRPTDSPRKAYFSPPIITATFYNRDTNHYNFEMVKTVKFRVEAKDEDNNAITNFRLVLKDQSKTNSLNREFIADVSNGIFEAELQPYTHYNMTIQTDDYALHGEKIFTGLNSEINKQAVLKPGNKLFLDLATTSTVPLPDEITLVLTREVSQIVSYVEPDTGTVFRGKRNQSKLYEVEGLPKGQLTLDIEADGFDTKRIKSIRATNLESGAVKVDLQEATTLTGKIEWELKNGIPPIVLPMLMDYYINYQEDGSDSVESKKLGSNQFILTDLKPNTNYKIQTSRQKFHIDEKAKIVKPGEKNFVLQIPWEAKTGKIYVFGLYDATTSEPVTQANVLRNSLSAGNRKIAAHEFAYAGDEPYYWFTITADGYPDQTVDGDLSSVVDGETIKIPLRRQYLKGKILSKSNNRPLGDAQIKLRTLDGIGNEEEKITFSNSNGDFSLVHAGQLNSFFSIHMPSNSTIHNYHLSLNEALDVDLGEIYVGEHQRRNIKFILEDGSLVTFGTAYSCYPFPSDIRGNYNRIKKQPLTAVVGKNGVSNLNLDDGTYIIKFFPIPNRPRTDFEKIIKLDSSLEKIKEVIIGTKKLDLYITYSLPPSEKVRVQLSNVVEPEDIYTTFMNIDKKKNSINKIITVHKGSWNINVFNADSDPEEILFSDKLEITDDSVSSYTLKIN